jgi:hypothetical protein
MWSDFPIAGVWVLRIGLYQFLKGRLQKYRFLSVWMEPQICICGIPRLRE